MELALDLSPPESKHYRSWNERLRYVARYSQPEEIHVACERARVIGASALMVSLDGRNERAVGDFQLWRKLSTWVVVPNMNAFIRDLTDRGPAGAAIARFFRLRPRDMWLAGVGAVREGRRLARSDFVAAALWLAGMELSAARPLRARRVFLHPQLAEVGLAGRVTELFTEFAARVSDLGMEAGLITNNPLVAADVLGPRLEAFSAIVSPCNPRGYKMVPERKACETLFRSQRAQFWAHEITASGSVDLAESLAYVRDLGLAGSLLDFKALKTAAHEGSGSRGRWS